MKIFVKAKTKAKENKIEPPTKRLWADDNREETYYKVFVTEAPVRGKANAAILKLLAEYFKVSNSCVTLLSGASSKTKVFEII